MRTVLLTSSSYRHKYLSHTKTQNSKLQYYLKKSSYYSQQSKTSKKYQNILKNLLAEKSIFGNYEFEKMNVFYLEKGSINEKKYIEKAEKVNPEFILLFGTEF